MKKIINISKPEELLLIVDVIHDCKFDKEKINLDPKTSILGINFYREEWEKRRIAGKFLIFKKLQVPIRESTLKISHVKSYHIQEGTQPGPGSEDFFNTITYNKEEKEIKISTVIGKGITIKAGELELSIEESEKIVEKKTCFTIFA